MVAQFRPVAHEASSRVGRRGFHRRCPTGLGVSNEDVIPQLAVGFRMLQILPTLFHERGEGRFVLIVRAVVPEEPTLVADLVEVQWSLREHSVRYVTAACSLRNSLFLVDLLPRKQEGKPVIAASGRYVRADTGWRAAWDQN